MTVISDADSLNDASTTAVRLRFKQWAARVPREEQGGGPRRSQRYRYCIQVDEEALQSVLDEPESSQSHRISNGFVNLIWKDWKPSELEDEEEEDDSDDDSDSIEGYTQHGIKSLWRTSITNCEG